MRLMYFSHYESVNKHLLIYTYINKNNYYLPVTVLNARSTKKGQKTIPALQELTV